MHNNLEGFTLDYKIKRVAFVNSASHGYSVIRLDDHLALFGDNNAGKTASLAATKLMLYPETNFEKCYKKFKFEGSGGAYSQEDSFQFYFPSDVSFLVMEIESSGQTSCVVSYRAKNYHYFRLFIPVTYDELAPLFWDQTKNNGRGDFADDIGIAKLKTFAKKYKNSIDVDRPERLVELMYGNVGKEDSRYCIVPLIDNNKPAVQAFRNIFQMAFDTGGNSRSSLADAIATLIEMKHSRPQERVSADLTRLEFEYQQLIKKGEELKTLSNNQGRYNELKDLVDGLVEEEVLIACHYKVLKNQLNEQKSGYESQERQINDNLTAANNTLNAIKSQSEALTKKGNLLEGGMGGFRDRVEELSHHVTVAEKAMGEHKITNAVVLLDVLGDILENLEQEYEALNDAEDTAKLLAELVKDQNQTRGRLSRAKKKAENLDALTLSHLPAATASVLASLNKDFAGITVTLSANAERVVNEFAGLFDTDGALLAIAGEELGTTKVTEFSAEQQAELLRTEIEQLTASNTKLSERITSINKTLKDSSGESRRLRLLDVNKELVATREQIGALKRYEVAADEIAKAEKKLQEQERAAAQVAAELIDVTLKQESASQVSRQLADQRRNLINQAQMFEGFATHLSHVERAIEVTSINDSVLETVESLNITLDKGTTAALAERASVLAKAKTICIPRLTRFFDEVPNERNERGIDIFELSKAKMMLANYNTSFIRLDDDKAMQIRDIAKHNNIVGNQLKEISDAHRILSTNIKDINTELNTHKISNLEKVNLKLHVKSDFDHVYSLSKTYDASQKGLMGRDFYESLIAYTNQHANKQTGLIKMRDIIKDITFEYEAADGKITTKSQSGGTTSTITASIIAILLKRIFMVNTTFKMPIIIDEISALDGTNTKMIIECIEEHGFAAFCATPQTNAVLCQSVGRWVTVDHNTFGDRVKPMIENCILNILPLPGITRVWGEQPIDYSYDSNGNFVPVESGTDTSDIETTNTLNQANQEQSDEVVVMYETSIEVDL